MTIVTDEQLGEILSTAIAHKSGTYVDLISNSNAALYCMKKNNMMKTFEGPTIRQTLAFAESDTYTRYSGFGFQNPKPAEVLGDAEFTPKQASVSVAIAGDQLLGNMGSKTQLLNIMETKIDLAEQELEDRFVEDLHSDGTADGGIQIGGFQLAIPTDPTVGTYGGISRASAPVWRTQTFTAAGDFAALDVAVPADLRKMWRQVAIKTSVGKNGPDLILASEDHYVVMEESFTEIQRITNDDDMASMGFTTLIFNAGGRKMKIVLEGGQGSAMPSNTSYFLNSKDMAFYADKNRNFTSFGGKQRPINQDGVVQKIGFRGELVLANPRHTAKFTG